MKESSSKKRQDNIDLLRAIAILSVLAFHYTSRFPADFYNAPSMPFQFWYGHYGVDLFFTVSGFCIFMTLSSSRSLENFWARRIARIQPAYVAAIILTFVVLHLVELPGRTVGAWVAASNVFWLNIIPNWPMVDSAYWSLVVELKFYLWIGLIYWAMGGRHISLAWAGFSLAGVVLTLLGDTARKLSDTLIIGSFAPAFLAGLLAYEWPRLRAAERGAVGCVALLLLYLSPRYHELPWLGPAICLPAAVILRASWLRVPRIITVIGLISYSLYLLHQNIGYVLLRSLPGSIELRLVLTVTTMLVLAGAFYWGIERRWEVSARHLFERILGHGRGFLRLPRRGIPRDGIEAEMRAW